MPDIFLSYSREDQDVARRYAETFQAQGFEVWWDVTLRSGENYDQVTEKALREAKAVVVLWSKTSVDSRWVRAEATQAAQNETLVPAMIEACRRPIMFELTQTAELMHWQGDLSDKAWLAFMADVKRFIEARSAAPEVKAAAAPVQPAPPRSPDPNRLSICVLPFSNMSGDAEQEYFSDGITEDIITDLSKVSALGVVSRNTAFSYKGKTVKVRQVASELRVSHVMEGSVRKAGGRVRITAQLIDGKNDEHVWAERYDRDLGDIFALQDEISQAIVKALKLKLLPEEKKAIERRGTDNADAYNLYLMARQNFATGNFGDIRREETVIRLCTRATEMDPRYARAWALLAMAQNSLRYQFGKGGDGGQASAERALSLDSNLAEAHAVMATLLSESRHQDQASQELAAALRLDPDSHEVNRTAAYIHFRQRRVEEAIRYFKKAAALIESDFSSPAMLITCYTATGDQEALRRAAELTIARVDKVVAQDRNNGAAIGLGVSALIVLGETERAKEWMDRGLLIDPDNRNMRYNFACDMAAQLKDADAAIELLRPVLAEMTVDFLNHAKADPDLDLLRDDPRFRAMMVEAEARLATEGGVNA